MLPRTRPSINWLRLPIRVPIVLQFRLLQRLYGLGLVNECVPRIVVAYKVGHNAPNCVWPFSATEILVSSSSLFRKNLALGIVELDLQL